MTETQQLSIPAAEYHASEGLSYSGLKDLAVSPYRYWWIWKSPDRPERKETAEMRFGTALHTAVLEPSSFETRYCPEIDESDFPEGCLVTMDDLRGWLKDKGYRPNGARKADLVSQVTAIAPEVPILDVVRERDELENADKVRLSKEDWARVRSAADSLRSEPRVQEVLAAGRSEVSYSVIDPEFGVPLKARLDWITPDYTFDIKSFSQQRGKSIDKCVIDAIWYEKYYLQAYFYARVRAIAEGRNKRSGAQTGPVHMFGFTESEQPHETRIRLMRPSIGGEPNMLWDRARSEALTLIRKYAECVKRFGDRPWREPQDAELVIDEELPQLLWN